MSDPAAPLQPVSALLAARERPHPGCVRFHPSEDWLQGRTTFGGLLSALAAQAMRDVCGSDWPLRALQTSFVGPVVPGPMEVEVHLLRQGKNVRQVQARVLQHGQDGLPQTCGVLLGVFGTARASAMPALTPQPPTLERGLAEATQWPYIPGMMPAFTQHLDFRHAEGGVPFTGSEHWHSRVFLRLKDDQGVDNELQAILLADAGPTPALARLNGFAPASSVSWALELRPVQEDTRDAHWRMDKDALVTGEGYVNEKTALWTPDGQLAALGYQVVAVYG